MAITPVLLTIHTLIVLALIGFVLIQRSDGGALGLGGGGGGGFMTGRGAANVLTRTTSVLAALFFATSIGLAFLANPGESDLDVIEDLTGEDLSDPDRATTAEDLLRTIGGGSAADDEEAAPVDSDQLLDAIGAAESQIESAADAAVEAGTDAVSEAAGSADASAADEDDAQTPNDEPPSQ